MALASGTRIGSYEIVAQIGVGGMGEVYRATDTNLKRQVAIKVLPETLAADAERLARFQREAEVLAALNHPHIAAIYGLERSSSTAAGQAAQTALVMELVEGPTLADRIAQGAVPVDEALAIATQITEALEAAHEQGIIHRDLKPANIKLRPDGTVKVLDFGLAKAMEPAAASSASLSMSPTITTPAMTQAGLILGTAAYMSPEQAKGRPADRRSDVWAFGAVLYEMLTGKRAFGGEDISETLADVMRVEPAWSPLPDGLSPTLVVYLKRCLAKDPRQRVHDIADMRLALEGAFEAAGPAPAPQVAVDRGRSPLAWVLAAAVLAATAASVATWTLTRPGPQPVTKFDQALDGESFTRNGRPVLAISRDGRRLVYVAENQLYLRNLDDPQARPIPGTDENPSSPAFSPDGESVAFWSSESSLKKILVTGGTPIRLTEAENPYGVSWELDGTIVYGQADGIWRRVSENGGAPEQLVAVEEGERINGPQLLPGGNALLFASTTAAGTPGWETADVVVQTIGTGDRTVVIAGGGAFPRYVPSGHLVYAQGNTLLAQPFDPGARTTSRGPVPVVPGVMRAPSSDIGIAQYAFSDNGVLVYAPGAGDRIETSLALIDRNGNSRVLPNSSGLLSLDPRFSPDGTRIAVHREDVNDLRNVWIYEMADSQWRQLTFDGGAYPIWTPDGTAVTFLRDGSLWQAASDFSGEPEPLPGTAGAAGPSVWSSDGTLLYMTGNEIRAFSPEAGDAGAGTSLLPGGNATAVFMASFSADGRWVAYTELSDTPDVYVSPYPFGAGGRRRITNAGGEHPRWSRDGRELFVSTSEGLVAYAMTTEPTLAWSNPELAFPWPGPAFLPLAGPDGTRGGYDVSPDGQQVVAVAVASEAEESGADSLRIVMNWFDDLERLVPTE